MKGGYTINDLWKILEIDPTSEISTIKKAYAKKLRIYNPEDDAQGFQMLREAYDSALKFAKNNHLRDDLIDNVPQNNYTPHNVHLRDDFIDDVPNDNYTPHIIHLRDDFIDDVPENNYNPHNVHLRDDFIDRPIDYEKLVYQFFESVNVLYSDFFSRIDENNWKKLLNNEIVWNLDYTKLINTKMIEFIVGHRYLPKNIWQLFNENFHWDDQWNYLYSYYDKFFVDFIFRQIGPSKVPRYIYFTKNMNIDFDLYLNYRETIFSGLLENDLKKVEHYLPLAYKMYPNDPDLLFMMGDYYFRIKKRMKAASKFKAAIRVNPNDMDMYFFEAKIMFKYNNFTRAINLCKCIKCHTSNDFEIRSIIGKCDFNLGKLYKANKIFLNNLKINNLDIETTEYLKKLVNQFQLRLIKHGFNFRLRHELKQTYEALGEYNYKDKMKISFSDVRILIKRIFFLAISIGLIFATYGLLLIVVLIIELIKHLYISFKHRWLT